MWDSIPWIEKYRPSTTGDIFVDDIIKQQIMNIVEQNGQKHIIISGPPGVGKTSTLLCIAKELLGPELMSTNLHKVNASGDRGAKKIEESIQSFCKKMSNNKKIIIFDEMDNITIPAQHVINSYIKDCGPNIIFTFTCNDPSKIIESIQSSCTLMIYRKISNDNMKSRLRYICEMELVEYDEDGLDKIIKISNGDLRSAINTLQLVSNGSPSNNRIVSIENIDLFCDEPNPDSVWEIINACHMGNVRKACNETIMLKNSGHSSTDILNNILKTIKQSPDVKMATAMIFSKAIYQSLLMVSRNIDTKLQLCSFIPLVIDMLENDSI